jgi:uncharacterized membrane protein
MKKDKTTLRIVIWTLSILLLLLYILLQIHIQEGNSHFLKNSFIGIYLTISGLFIFNLNKLLKENLKI